MADKAPNPFGLSDKTLSTITEKQMVVTYRMANYDSVNPLTGKPVIPPTEILPSDYIFHDEYEPDVNKRNKLLQNVISTLPKTLADERVIMANKTGDVVFNSGFFTVDTIKQRLLFIWLELHPGNGSNRFRPDNAPVIFKRETVEKAEKEVVSDEYLSAQAIVLLSRMNTADKMAILEANQVGSTVNKDSQAIELDVIALAKKSPTAIISNMKDEKSKVKIMLSNARNRGVLLMNQETGSVSLKDDSNIELINVSGKPDAADLILSFFLDKKNKKHLENLEAQLSYDPFAIEV